MLGTPDNPGIMTLTLRRLFDAIGEKSATRTYRFKFSYLEVYNEMIRDLLGENPTEVLDLREDPVKGLAVAGLSERTGETAEQVMQYLFLGNKNRTQESTGANETSSRSHAVFQIVVEYTEKDGGPGAEIKTGKLSMIDLAGSERAANTNNRGIRMVEGANINRSLLALGNCINKLSDQILRGQHVYIPYRDSKLTRLLKDSLGGNCQTVMIANISPSSASYEDTHNTLKYANRAKEIKTKAVKNIRSVQSHISQYTQLIAQLKQEAMSLRKQLAISKSASGSTSDFCYSDIELPCISQAVEEEVGKLLEELNEHFTEDGNVRKSLYKIRQKIETLSLAIMVKKSHYETLGKAEKAGQDLLREVSSNEIQLKQLLINEEVLANRIREMQHERDQMALNIKQKQLLADKWIAILSGQIEHDKNVAQMIPTEGDVIGREAQDMAETQNGVIARLREQLQLRDDMIAKTRTQLKERDVDIADAAGEGMMGFEEIVKAAQSEKTPRAKNSQLPPLPAAGSVAGGEKLFTRVPHFRLSRRQQPNLNPDVGGIKSSKKKGDDKRSYSVVSQNSSFSTGASSGAAPPGKLSRIVAKHAKGAGKGKRGRGTNPKRGGGAANRVSHRQLLNAGSRIVLGQPQQQQYRFQLKNERPSYPLPVAAASSEDVLY